MIESEIARGFGEALTAAVGAWAISRVKSQAPSSRERRQLRYSEFYLLVGWAGIVLFTFCLLMATLSENPSGHSWWVQGIFGGFALLSGMLVRMYHRCALDYSKEAIRYQPLWGEPFSFTWRDVSKVSYNPLGEWWRLRVDKGRSVRVGVMMHGAADFMQTLATLGKVSIAPVGLRNGKVLRFYGPSSEPSMRSSSPSDQA